MNIKDLPIITVTGPTCSGKTTFVHQLMDTKFEHGLRFGEIISHTTRAPRPGEIDGKHYYFVSREKFLDMRIRDEFAEIVDFNGEYYATSARSIQNSFEGYQIPIVIVEPFGAEQYQKYCTEHHLLCISVFMDVDHHIAVKRFLNRDLINVATEKFLSRLDTIYNVEQGWLEAQPWDIIIASYNEMNTTTIPVLFGNWLWHFLVAKDSGIHFNLKSKYVLDKTPKRKK